MRAPPRSTLTFQLWLHTAVERVLRQMPHLNPVGRHLSFMVVDDGVQKSSRRRPRRGLVSDTMERAQVISERTRVLIPSASLAQMNEQELTSLVAHEMIHVYYRHAERGHGKDPKLWQRAADYEANSALKAAGFTLSADALFDEALSDRSAEALYELFKSERSGQRQGQTSPSGGAGAPQHEWEQARAPWGPSASEVLVTVSVSEVAQRGAPLSMGSIIGEGDSPDPHSCPSSERGYGTQQLEEALAFRAKALPSSTRHWASLLQDFMRHRARRRSSGRYRRRDIGRELYVPSMRGDGLRLAVALDTSGSTVELLPDLINEVEHVMRACPHFELTLIQCSAEVSAVDRLTHRDLNQIKQVNLKGGGGTSFQPVFDLLNSGAHPLPNLLIYLTDGKGPKVEQAPNFPVIWVLSDGGRRPASFGVELPLIQS